MIEAQAQETAFPTVADVLASVRASAIESVSAGNIEAFTDVFFCNPFESDQPDMALINFIAYAGAAFAVSEFYRAEGNGDQADMFHAMGQDLLAHALETLGAFIAIGIQTNGIQVH
jgi:hypothetical protein